MFFVGGLIGLFIIGVILYKTYIYFIKHPFKVSKPLMIQINKNIAPYIMVAFLGWFSGFGNIFFDWAIFTRYLYC